ncbi:MAG: hypothetical protein MI862_05485 [Desulfobacterales bacterium]|nr:hypothetical protein [Desulfobacterales bacterium]
MSENKYIPRFKSLRKAVTALQDAGFEISRSKMSRDRKNGLVDFNDDNTVDQTEVEKYSRLLKRKEAGLGDPKENQSQKTEWEVKNLQLKHEKELFLFEREKGKYIEKALWHSELAARAAILETGLKHSISAKIQDLIALVGGKPEKSPELLEMLNRFLDEELNGYANTKNFQVVFMGDEDS